MKHGHRQCYMSRAFAQQHNFIPKDAAPGFYGFSGITNRKLSTDCRSLRRCALRSGALVRAYAPELTSQVGSWPIKVGSKTVEQQVMLVEQAFFPVVLGRSFMEKRQVRFDPLDQTAVLFQVRSPLSQLADAFQDTGEYVPTDVVVVKDANGAAITVS